MHDADCSQQFSLSEWVSVVTVRGELANSVEICLHTEQVAFVERSKYAVVTILNRCYRRLSKFKLFAIVSSNQVFFEKSKVRIVVQLIYSINFDKKKTEVEYKQRINIYHIRWNDGAMR